MRSKIKVRLAYFTTKTAEIRMTRDMAHQLDVRPTSERWNQATAGKEAPAPLAKVLGKVLGLPMKNHWHLLIEHPVSHLAWTLAVDPDEILKQKMIKDGGWVDDMSSIPTILV